jgi:hypothetical protein
MDLLAELACLTGALEAAGIDYALCGAIALAIHGVCRATQNIDLLAREADLDELREVARSCGFVVESLPMTFASSDITVQRFTKLVGAQPLMLDVLFADGSLASVWDSRQTLEWRGGRVRVVSKEGLTTLKLLAGRAQDLVDLLRLQEVFRD